MTCTCKAELAAILRDEATLWKESGDGDGFHIGICRAFATLAERLCPQAEPARGPCTCNRNHVDDDEHAPDCGKPAPVAFDADAVAKKMVHWNSVRKLWSLWQPNGEVCVCYLMPGSDDEEPGANELSAIKHIAAALRAAEAAGYARGRAEGQR